MKKKIGKEYPPADEDFYIGRMVDELKKQMNQLFPSSKKMLRQAESKMHGCLSAKFIIDPNLEKKYRVGLFSEPHTYDAFVRFSNAKTGISKDAAKDQQGIAVKLIGVKGEKIISSEHLAGTQDFIGLNFETFVSKSVKEFAGIIKAFTSGKISLALFVLNPLHWPLFIRVLKHKSIISSVLEQNFWSTTAYQFGDKKAIKFMFRSTLDPDTPLQKKPGPDYLKNQMTSFLNKSDMSFDFLVQFQEDAVKMPIENPTVKWKSNYVKLASLYIPKQVFDTDDHRIFGDALSFNPWHSLPAHRPLGGLNRARLRIYKELSEHRHNANQQKVFEPKDMSFKIPNNN